MSLINPSITSAGNPASNTTSQPFGPSTLSGPGSRRKIGNHDAQRAERLARKYMRRYGAAGAKAAAGLLDQAAASRMDTPSLITEAGRKAQSKFQMEQDDQLNTRREEQARILEDRKRKLSDPGYIPPYTGIPSYTGT